MFPFSVLCGGHELWGSWLQIVSYHSFLHFPNWGERIVHHTTSRLGFVRGFHLKYFTASTWRGCCFRIQRPTCRAHVHQQPCIVPHDLQPLVGNWQVILGLYYFEVSNGLLLTSFIQSVLDVTRILSTITPVSFLQHEHYHGGWLLHVKGVILPCILPTVCFPERTLARYSNTFLYNMWINGMVPRTLCNGPTKQRITSSRVRWSTSAFSPTNLSTQPC